MDNISIKDDLLPKLQAIDYTNQGENGVLTDLTFDDVFNDYNDFIKSYLYREVPPAIVSIVFFQYNKAILLNRQDDSAFFVIQDENSTDYYVYIVDENNNIKIYGKKETGPLPG